MVVVEDSKLQPFLLYLGQAKYFPFQVTLRAVYFWACRFAYPRPQQCPPMQTPHQFPVGFYWIPALACLPSLIFLLLSSWPWTSHIAWNRLLQKSSLSLSQDFHSCLYFPLSVRALRPSLGSGLGSDLAGRAFPVPSNAECPRHSLPCLPQHSLVPSAHSHLRSSRVCFSRCVLLSCPHSQGSSLRADLSSAVSECCAPSGWTTVVSDPKQEAKT